jgi:HEAT repeat protein
LADSNRGVRFVSAMNVGLLTACSERALVEPLLRDESESVRAAAIFALMRCGRQVDPTPLAAMLRSDDPEVRGNAALILGELGNPTALPMLRQSAGQGMLAVNSARVRIVELQVAEAQFKLGDMTAADPIRAALFAPPQQSEFAALACQISGRIGDQAATAALERLVDATGEDERPPEVRLAAAAALAQLRPVRPIDVEMAESMLLSDLPQVRGQAAITLARMGRAQSLLAVQRLLADPDPGVQVAAAGAVLRLTAGN